MCLLQKWYDGFRSRSPIYYYGREERPNTGLAEISLLPPGEYCKCNAEICRAFGSLAKFFRKDIPNMVLLTAFLTKNIAKPEW